MILSNHWYFRLPGQSKGDSGELDSAKMELKDSRNGASVWIAPRRIWMSRGNGGGSWWCISSFGMRRMLCTHSHESGFVRLVQWRTHPWMLSQSVDVETLSWILDKDAVEEQIVSLGRQETQRWDTLLQSNGTTTTRRALLFLLECCSCCPIITILHHRRQRR